MDRRPSFFRRLSLALLLVVFSTSSFGALPWCKLYLERLSQTYLREKPISWPSTQLRPGPISFLRGPEAAKKRVREIADQIWDPNSAVGREYDASINDRMANTDQFLRDYFTSYEVFYWSPLYQGVVERMHAAAPKIGRLLDVGSATGGLGGQLAEASVGRAVTFLDNQNAMNLAKDRVGHIFRGEEGRFGYLPIYMGPRSQIPAPHRFEGALMNHVMYTMLPKSKEGTVKAIADALEPGGTFAVNEPVREVAAVGENHKEWLIKMVETAVENGAPHTEFDIANIFAMASGRATQSLRQGQKLEPPFLTRKEHEDLFAANGLEIVRSEPTYDGFSRFWVLRKKVPAPEPK